MNFIDRVERLRPRLNGVTLKQIVTGSIDSELATEIDGLLRDALSRERLPMDVITLSRIEEITEQAWGVSPWEITDWCSDRFGNVHRMPYVVTSLAMAAFGAHCGAYWSLGEAKRRCPELEYDDDGLVINAKHGNLTFRKEGILFDNYLLMYSPFIRRYNLGLSNGFMERFTAFANRKPDVPERFGLLIDPDIVINRTFHVALETRAYIRGPLGLSIEKLQNPSFPEDPSGTVTEYHRTSPHPAVALLGPHIHSLQVMWSFRDGVKTIQMEELVPADARQFSDEPHIMNRYVHSRWDVRSERFIHLDGAVRVYDKETYSNRFETDLRNRGDKAKADQYHKLFRLDTPLSLNEWCQLVARFFYENELVTEYLSGARE